MLMNPVGQGFGQNTTGTAYLCSTTPGASPGRRHGWGSIIWKYLHSEDEAVFPLGTSAEAAAGTPTFGFSGWPGPIHSVLSSVYSHLHGYLRL